MNIIEHCKIKINENHEEFIEPLCHIITCILKPFIECKSFQYVKYHSIIFQCFELIVTLLSMRYAVINIAVAKVAFIFIF